MNVFEICQGLQAYYFESLSSTVDKAKEFALEGACEGTVIIAKTQTAGRGRRGRVWQSPVGNLYVTYITYPKCHLAKVAELSFVTCVAVGEALQTFLASENANLIYKWPNDLLLNQKKVGGILLEIIPLDPDEKEEFALSISFGINLSKMPVNPLYPVTSFKEEGIAMDYDRVLNATCESLQKKIQLWQTQGFEPIKKAWLEKAFGLDENIKVTYRDSFKEGIFKGIDEKGALLLEDDNQSVLKIPAGDIILC